MAPSRIQRSVVFSTAGHVGVLAVAFLTFAVKPFDGVPQESLPVEIMSESEFSQIMAGSKTAPQAPTPKPLVEKVAEPTTPADDPAPKVSDKQEIKTASAGDPPPMPEARPDPAPPAEAAAPDPKIDPIAEALKKDPPKKPAEKKVEAKPVPKKPPVKPVPKFDPRQVAALLDKRAPQHHATTGQVVNTTASLGLPNAHAMTLSQSEIDALRAQIQACWSPPAGAAEDPNLVVKVRLQLNQDGSLSAEPVLLNHGTGMFQITAESALRAVRRCQPFKLPIAKYEVWRDVEVTFDPRDMLRG